MRAERGEAGSDRQLSCRGLIPRNAREGLHGFATGEQALGIVVGRQFDQRAVEFDAGLTGGTGGLKRRDKTARARQFVIVR
jgi:hypothetical protein